jgi:DNA-directed RNA polymerase subunit RPC12/RpoP
MTDAWVGPVTGRDPYTEAEMAQMDPNQTCVDCGAPVPNFPEHGNEIHEEDDTGEWVQRCPDCSFMASYSIENSDGEVIYG